MTTLRQKMIDDLQLRNYSPGTIEAYIRHVAQFAKHFGQPPDQLGLDHVRQYQLYLIRQKQVSWATLNQVVAALRSFYHTTLGQTLPDQLSSLALQNKRVIYGLLFKAASETLLEIAADP
jgi:hypothetical protein